LISWLSSPPLERECCSSEVLETEKQSVTSVSALVKRVPTQLQEYVPKAENSRELEEEDDDYLNSTASYEYN
jgi:hypothetical protein